MVHLYCISGFGADESVFSKLQLEDSDIHFIPWLIPSKKETLSAYATRMAGQIYHKDPILLGLSFGGMMCIEIAKLVPVKVVILISSFKTYLELPSWMRLAGAIGMHHLVPLKSFKLTEPLQNYNLGIETTEEKTMVTNYRKNVNQQYTNWAINKILTWKNIWKPDKLFHIHGGKDRLLPIGNIKADYVIKSGGHMMIMNRAGEVSEWLNKILHDLSVEMPDENV